MTDLIRSPLRWIGSKTRLLPWLLPQLNVCCTTYCEPFGGSAAVLLNRNPVKQEVYNDVDGALATFMLCVRDHAHELARLIADVPYSRAGRRHEVEWLKAGCPGRMTDLQFCARWWWLNLTGYNGFVEHGLATRAGSNMQMAIRNSLKQLEGASVRLRDVLVESDDFRTVLYRYDSDRTLFYCDPPYVGTEDLYRACGFSEVDHRELARILNSAKGFVAVSYYPHPLIDELYPKDKWRRLKKSHYTTMGPAGSRSRERTELLLLNYEFAK